MEKGNTHLILAPLLEGMRVAGASVETIYPQKLKIRHCIGDFQCWFEKVGVCIHTDDMEMVYAKIREADILVLATPIYLPLPSAFQNLLNRMMPLIEPLLELRNGRTRAKWHDNVKVSKIVFVSSGGWWEAGNFEVVTHIVEEIAENSKSEFIGPIIRPHADQLREQSEKANEVFRAAELAGKQIIETGKVEQNLLDTISQPLITHDQAIEGGNRSYLSARDS